jgi:hypothetical protein
MIDIRHNLLCVTSQTGLYLKQADAGPYSTLKASFF